MQRALPEIFEGGRQDLLPPSLPVCVCDLQEVSHESCVALCVRQLVGIDVTNGANDGLGEGILIQLELPQESCCAIVDVDLLNRSTLCGLHFLLHGPALCSCQRPSQPGTLPHHSLRKEEGRGSAYPISKTASGVTIEVQTDWVLHDDAVFSS